MLPFFVRNEQYFKNRRSNIFPLRPYDRFLCSQGLHGIVRNQERVSQAYKMSMSKKWVHTNQQHFPLLLERNNAFRIVTQTDIEILISLVFVSLGDLTLFSGDKTKNFTKPDSGFGWHDFRQDDSGATWLVTLM